MRIRIQKRGLVPGLIVAILGTIGLYYASTAGLAAWHESRSAPKGGTGYLPTAVENVPASVPTTDVYGPPGSVSMVYAGTEVLAGLTGELERPWIAVSSQTGEYRALDVPHLPHPSTDGVSVSPDGGRLAWAGNGVLEVYDAVSGETSQPSVEGADRVGAFSPDGELLLVHAAGLRVVDVTAGEVVFEGDGDAEVVEAAVWRPDGVTFDYVADGQLVTVSVSDGEVSTQPTEIPTEATLAWSPEGDRLAEMHEVSGKFRLSLATLRGDRLGAPAPVDTSGISLQRLLGFSGPNTVAVNAYLLESGSVERLLDVSLTGGRPRDLVTLPQSGENWVGSETVSLATDTLVKGSYDYDDPVWPWSYVARLAACALVMFFLFGLWVTRRPRRR